MYKFYSYCSYKGSPSGFKLGVLTPEDKKVLCLSNKGVNEFIRNSFETGVVKGIYGKLPNCDQYVYLVKKLRYEQKADDTFASIFHMNFAFVFDRYKEYEDFLNGISMFEEDEISKMMSSVIIPNKEDEVYALNINGVELRKVLERISEKSDEITIGGSKEELYIKVVSRKTDVMKLEDIYKDEISDDRVLCRQDDYQFVLKKKNSNALVVLRKNLIMKYILCLILIIGLIVGVYKISIMIMDIFRVVFHH